MSECTESVESIKMYYKTKKLRKPVILASISTSDGDCRIDFVEFNNRYFIVKDKGEVVEETTMKEIEQVFKELRMEHLLWWK